MQTQTKIYTPAEYLALEEEAAYKSEYRDGEIVPIIYRTTNRNKITGNFFFQLKLALREENYEIYMGDVRLWIPQYSQCTYPDIMVIQGEPVYEGKGTTTVTNPCLIVEVLSNSTKNRDRGDKFQYYRSIPELREYILIDQYSYYGEQFKKQAEGEWIFKEYEGEEAVLSLEMRESQIRLQDIYSKVKFES
ncbi:MAG: Uma2 family endonuclease [Gomphosphaeria aponina SAG 52.96 = DSM 107014]|uniref:Uma2 family endonuclease n=1 Tax=Gomphosphaeria aponina SAG 52.96 = DSM 107014 TaxID=1521640 RepID=A0A941JPX6_9CHRO|nr:Uma2 family endonuclease [Gomphosphaeria aponina SAG 52.96 = DSM 107014]